MRWSKVRQRGVDTHKVSAQRLSEIISLALLFVFVCAAMLPDPPVPAELMSGFDRAVRMLAKRQAQEQLDTCVNQSAEPDSQQILPTEAADAAMSDAPSAASSSAVYAASPGLVLPPIQLPPILDPVARCDDALTLFECASRANKAMHEEASAHIQKWATQRNAEAWCNLVSRKQAQERAVALQFRCFADFCSVCVRCAA